MRPLLDPQQPIDLLFKSENRINFPATPMHAYGMPLPDCV
jgi:hypothetical protein